MFMHYSVSRILNLLLKFCNHCGYADLNQLSGHMNKHRMADVWILLYKAVVEDHEEQIEQFANTIEEVFVVEKEASP